MKRILVADDEPRVAAFVTKGLRANGFTTTTSHDGEEALALARTGEFDLLILDLGLPGMDGFEVLRLLREADRSMPVLVLTARDGVAHTVAALEAGADDYVTKPFSFQELLARVRVRLRDERSTTDPVLRAGDIELDLVARVVRVDGREVPLTAREFALAETFLRHPGHILSREQLLSHVWGYDYDPGSNVVDVYIGYLRRKLGPDRVVTVRGVGYRFATAARPSDRSGASGGAQVDGLQDDVDVVEQHAELPGPGGQG